MFLVNPRRACAARVTIVVLVCVCVCACVCSSVSSLLLLRASRPPNIGIRIQYDMEIFGDM